nr:RNA-directed DNA polymerase, eukaryota, nucleotide-binding alpha-beta plait domain protein [Tanacetum cinerariifolium]
MASKVCSNADLTRSISKSIFVTNFPDDTSAKALWSVCQTYGTVVDVFILNRKSKAGKRFAFVRFIRVDNVDRLVGNLCTLWIGRMHLHANVARFERTTSPPPRNTRPSQPARPSGFSFASVLHEKFVMGELKTFSSIPNLHSILLKEGFQNVNLTYMGGFWVMMELDSIKTKENLLQHVGVSSWFHRVCNVQSDFVANGRIVWVNIEGVPLHAWSRATFTKICSKWGEVMELEEDKDDLFARKRICVKTKLEDNILEKFKIIIRGKIFVIRAKELFAWSPVFKSVKEVEYCSDDESLNGEEALKCDNNIIPNAKSESDVDAVSDTCFGESVGNLDGDIAVEQPVNVNEQSSDPFGIYGLLGKKDVGAVFSETDKSLPFPPSFTPPSSKVDPIEQGSIGKAKSLNRSVFSRVVHDTHNIEVDLGSDGRGPACKTKMDNISEMEVKVLWGNYNFDYVFSESLGFSGGLLCVWDSSVFSVDNHIISDNFLAIYGSWIPTKTKLLVVSVYAPQVLSEKRLDRFLVSDGFTSIFPNMSAICLDRHLSDHRPILLRDVVIDYGATPFCFYHSWLNWNGFDHFITCTWNSISLDDSNASLIDIDRKLDQGGVNDDILLSRVNLMKQLHEFKASDTHESVMVDGDWVVDPICVKEVSEMECQVSNNDIRQAVWGCGEDKSPGPDGFSFDFCRKYWSIIGPDFCIAVRPISLIGCLYKVVTKILATRLSAVISGLISDVQTAFVPNRQILDGPFIVNELLDWCKRHKHQAMVFKVDFAKAYDSIRWNYLIG